MKQQLSQLNKTSKKSVALYHKVALSIGVSDSSLGILYALFESDTPCSQNDFCSERFIAKQTINSAVAALQKKGFVSLSPIPRTRNKKSITLTDEGKEFAGETIAKLQKAEVEALSQLTEEERELYVSLNEKYNSYLTEKIDEIVGAGDIWT